MTPAATLLCLFAFACTDDVDDTGSDAGSDTSGDVTEDTAGDTGSDSGTDSGTDTDDAGADTDVIDTDPGYSGPFEPTVLVDELDERWNEILPGGDTICSRGSEFAFYVRPGTVNKVVVEFQGGGACWDELTCGLADAIFNPDISSTRRGLSDAGRLTGIYDRDNAENPFRDWHHVYIPYCTGDIHWGNAQRTYDEGGSGEVTINHFGAVNAQAALDWTYANFDDPDTVFVTGCSAGAYGSLGWAPYIMEHYTDAEIYQMGDCGAGIITEDFFEESFPAWNAVGILPDWIPALDPNTVSYLDLSIPVLYGELGKYYPQHIVSQYNTIADNNQTFYFEAMGGSGVDAWSDAMVASIEEASSLADNFYAFIAAGDQHCVIPYEEFYSFEADGVQLVDWVRDLVSGEEIESRWCDTCVSTGEGGD